MRWGEPAASGGTPQGTLPLYHHLALLLVSLDSMGREGSSTKLCRMSPLLLSQQEGRDSTAHLRHWVGIQKGIHTLTQQGKLLMKFAPTPPSWGQQWGILALGNP